jgi:hypothetical protein
MRFLGRLVICLLVFSGGLKASAAEYVQYVRSHQQMVLPDRSVIPIGGELPVKYDAGDAWIPYLVLSLPRFPKSAGTLVAQTVFDPPIDGMVKQPTTLYVRINFANSLASRVVPDAHGHIANAAQPVRIILRQGDFYVVSAPQMPPGAMLPVGAVSVPPAALAQGRIQNLPPPEAKPTVSANNGVSLEPRSFSAPAAPRPADAPPGWWDSQSALYKFAFFTLLLVLIAVIPLDAKAHGQSNVAANPADPKWVLNSETGEYHRKVYNTTQGYLYDKRTYHEIWTERLQLLYAMTIKKRIIAVAGLATLATILITSGTDSHTRDLTDGQVVRFLITATGFCTVVLSAIVWLGHNLTLNTAKFELPPPPIQFSGREEVEDQQAYGNAGLATAAQVHQALREKKNAGPSLDDIVFED